MSIQQMLLAGVTSLAPPSGGSPFTIDASGREDAAEFSRGYASAAVTGGFVNGIITGSSISDTTPGAGWGAGQGIGGLYNYSTNSGDTYTSCLEIASPADPGQGFVDWVKLNSVTLYVGAHAVSYYQNGARVWYWTSGGGAPFGTINSGTNYSGEILLA